MRHTRKARGAGLLLIGLIVGMLLISPATAHFTQKTKHLGKHAWQQFIKQKVFTKKQANNRFYTKVQSDNRFIQDAPGTVSTANLAGGGVTKAKLANTFLETVAGGPSTITVGTVNAQTCTNFSLSTAVVHQTGDNVLVTPRSLAAGLITSGVRIPPFLFLPARPGVRVCNVTGGNIAAGDVVFDWELLRR